MLKRIEEPTNNIYNGVEFILRVLKNVDQWLWQAQE